MVKRLLEILYKEIKNLHQAAYLLGFFALFSQILGLIRDRLLAHSFGASQALDIYYASFRVPDLIFVSVASFVSVFVLIPFLTEKMKKDEGKEFISNVLSVFLTVLIVVAVAAFFLMPFIGRIFFGQFNGVEFESYVLLSRIMLLSPILLGLSNLFASVTQLNGRFFIYALSPVLYNLGIIAGIVFFYPLFGLAGLVWGVILGALLHLLSQVPFVARSKLRPRLKFHPNLSEFLKVVKISLPRTLALSAGNLALLFLISMASEVGDGSISVFNFSFNLQSVPLSIIGASYSVAAFPTLARFFTEGDKNKFAAQIITASRHIIFWSIPAAFLFIVLRAQIVRTVLGSGRFGWEETRLVAAALAVFSFSVLAQSLVLLFTRGYYAAGRTKTPLIINVFSSVFIVLSALLSVNLYGKFPYLKYFFESLLRIDFLGNTAVIMLALSYSLGMILNAALLWFFFKRDFEEFKISIKEAFFDSLAASFFTGFVSFQFLRVFDGIFDINTFWGIFLQGAFSGIVGVFFGIFILVLLGNREIKTAWNVLHQKIWRVRISGQERESLQ